MTIGDNEQQRQLNSLAERDQSVRAALLQEDPFVLYAALKKVPAPEPWLIELLRERRWFMRKLAGTPSLFRINGFGGTMLGRSDAAPDGTYIKTYFFTAIFVPVLAVREY